MNPTQSQALNQSRASTGRDITPGRLAIHGFGALLRRCATVWLAVWLCHVTASDGFAQSPSVPEATGVQVSIVALGRLPPSLRLKNGNKVVDIGIPASGRSSPFAYSGTSPLVMFEEVVDADGNTLRVPRVTATFPVEWKQVLLVLLPGESKTGPLRALVFDDSREGFPSNHVRLFNFYTTSLAISSAGVVEQLSTGESMLIDLPTRDALGRAWLKLAVQRRGEWQVLPTWITQAPPATRVLMFAYEQRNEEGILEPVYQTILDTTTSEAQLAMR